MMHDNKEQRLPHGSGFVIGAMIGAGFWFGLFIGVML